MATLKSSNFNFIAPFYDGLVRIIFGKSLWQAQQIHLNKIKQGDSILILGGGTGRIFDWLPLDCDITYLELSSAMIERAKKKGSAQFVHADFLIHSFEQRYHWIICPFFLDCFDEDNLKEVLEKISTLLNKNGNLIVTDFNASNSRQRGFSKVMIWFFRLIANLQSNRLLPIQVRVSEAGFFLKDSHFFRREFIFSDIYRKKETF